MTPNTSFTPRRLGRSDLHVTPIGLGTMTFGEQVDEPLAWAIMDRAVALGVTFFDTAEMYAVPPRAETFQVTEAIIGRWLAARPGLRQQLVLASKVAGPSRGMPWVRGGSLNLSAADIVAACEGSLRRLGVETLDLYQLHWPVRSVPMFGAIGYQPRDEAGLASLFEQLQALDGLVRAGKVRAIGLSNETPYGVHEFVRLAEQAGLARVASVQNNHSLLARTLENGLDETLHRLDVGFLAYSPLAFGLLSGKYDAQGLTGADVPEAARLKQFESSRRQRWGRPEALAAAREYNALARAHGLSPVQLALGWIYGQWRVSSTLIGVTSVAQLEADVAAWGTPISDELIAAIDAIRWRVRDPAV